MPNARYRRNDRRRISPMALLALGIVLAVGLVFMWLASYSPPMQPIVVSPEAAEHAQKAVESVEQKMAAVNSDAAEGKRRPFEISIDEKDTTNFLNSDTTVAGMLQGRKVERPTVEFKGQNITSTAYVQVGGQKVFVTVKGRLSQARPGRLAFHTSSVRLGRLPAPGRVKAKVDEMINAYLTFGRALPAEVTDIRVDGGKLTLAGVSDPAALRR